MVVDFYSIQNIFGGNRREEGFLAKEPTNSKRGGPTFENLIRWVSAMTKKLIKNESIRCGPVICCDLGSGVPKM